MKFIVVCGLLLSAMWLITNPMIYQMGDMTLVRLLIEQGCILVVMIGLWCLMRYLFEKEKRERKW